MSKKKGANKKGKVTASEDDWDSILEAELAAKVAAEPAVAPPTIAPTPVHTVVTVSLHGKMKHHYINKEIY
jgi:hypothetical protein